MHRRLALILLLFSLSACHTGRYTAAGSTGITPFVLERFDAYLASGLRVIVEPDHRAPLVSLTTVVRIGAGADPQEQSGLANLTARLTLRARQSSGVPRRDA